jgi:hypothetical protein
MNNSAIKEQKPWFYDILNNFFPFLALFFIVFGTITNLWSSIVCFRVQKTQSSSSFRILAVMFLVAPTTLYTWNLDVFLDFIYKVRVNGAADLSEFNIVEGLSVPLCRIFIFLQFFGLISTSWLLFLMVFDQVLKLYFANLNYHKKPEYMTYISFTIVVATFAVNFHMLLLNGRVKFTDDELRVMNETNKFITHKCYDSDHYNFGLYYKVMINFMSEFVPAGFIFICALLICMKLRIKKSLQETMNVRNLRKRRMFSITFLIISVFFYISSIPTMLGFSFFFAEIQKIRYAELLLTFFDELKFSYFAFLPTIFYSTNEKFRKEVKRFRISSELSATDDTARTK